MTSEPTISFKRPESVLVLISTDDNDVLLIERTDIPEFWQSVTGSLKHNEAPADAAARELKEETGLVAVPIDCQKSVRYEINPAWQKRFAPGVTHNQEHWFQVRLSARTAIVLNPQEHSQLVWLPIQAAIEKCSSASNRSAMKQFLL